MDKQEEYLMMLTIGLLFLLAIAIVMALWRAADLALGAA